MFSNIPDNVSFSVRATLYVLSIYVILLACFRSSVNSSSRNTTTYQFTLNNHCVQESDIPATTPFYPSTYLQCAADVKDRRAAWMLIKPTEKRSTVLCSYLKDVTEKPPTLGCDQLDAAVELFRNRPHCKYPCKSIINVWEETYCLIWSGLIANRGPSISVCNEDFEATLPRVDSLDDLERILSLARKSDGNPYYYWMDATQVTLDADGNPKVTWSNGREVNPELWYGSPPNAVSPDYPTYLDVSFNRLKVTTNWSQLVVICMQNCVVP